jgi:4-hydroxy-3-polyprenylbenzoate decarboxylase
MGIDATTKIPPETEHEWGEPLKSDADVAAMVDRRWAEYGLGDIEPSTPFDRLRATPLRLKLEEVDPNLFGYDMQT